MSSQFTYPFSYVPSPPIVDAARRLIASIHDGSSGLDGRAVSSLLEGKMLGVLMYEGGFIYAFSGLADGRAVLPGFVPPIFDFTSPDGYFRRREAEISAMPPSLVRAEASARLQDWLFERYEVMNALGQRATVKEIFAVRGLVPPGGTGDCAAPRLLNHAFRNGIKPIAMGECWCGASPHGEVREEGRFYPACMGKCGPLLTWMMQGLDVASDPLDSFYSVPDTPSVVDADKDIIVVVKPSGMLSVPGRNGTSLSLLEWLSVRYGEVYSCHRLDMDTSGLMVYARSRKAQAALESQFASGEVRKTYRARLVGGPWNHARKGTIALPLSADYYDRPRQCVDRVSGKLAVTRYEVLATLPNGETEVLFTPMTGRTHQLRVHAAHADGLGHPIKGDRLYGSAECGRLWLHACSLEFHHPVSGDVRQYHDERMI